VGDARRHEPCRHQTSGTFQGEVCDRITGERRHGCSNGADNEKIHVSIDDATCLAYVEVLPDEQKVTTVEFMACAVGWFS